MSAGGCEGSRERKCGLFLARGGGLWGNVASAAGCGQNACSTHVPARQRKNAWK